MSKLESGNMTFENISFDMEDVLKDILTVTEMQAADRGVSVIRQEMALQNKRFIGSPVHIKRLLMNILGNAVKYNKDNGAIYFSCKELEQHNGHAMLEFKCRDTGIGIGKDFLAHIYEPFAQENAVPRTKYAGTGLGLSIAKKLTEKMNGMIAVESTQGVGTTFTITLPLQIDFSAPDAAPEAEENQQVSLKGLHIMLVEDNELNMEIAKFLLEEEGAVITSAWNGQEAVDLFENSPVGAFDAIMMDVMMPVMDGYAATRAIRASDKPDAQTIPIIAMTANAFVDDRLKAKNAGMNAHIAKPLDTALLMKTIAKFVKKN